MKAIRLLSMGLFVMGAIFLIASASPRQALAQEFDFDRELFYFEYPGPWPFPDGDPVCNDLHELHPNYCNYQHIDDWRDNGNLKLDACDYIKVDGIWYHVDARTVTITLVKKPELNPDSLIYFEFMEFVDDTIWDPICTNWHEIYPNYCQRWHCSSFDPNETPYLDSCDQIDFHKIGEADTVDFHVIKVSTDYILKKGQPPGGIPTTTQWGIIILAVLIVSSGVFIALRRRKAAVPA